MPTFTEPEVVNDTRILPPYHVILLNDEDHTYQYVIHMLQTLFGHPQERGYQLAVEVDKKGRAIVSPLPRNMPNLSVIKSMLLGLILLVAKIAKAR
jgi:ATP-dependent Clp protease adaptor protein ClpS